MEYVRSHLSSLIIAVAVPFCLWLIVTMVGRSGDEGYWVTAEALYPVPGTEFAHPAGYRFSLGYKATGVYFLSRLGVSGGIEGAVLIPEGKTRTYVPLEQRHIEAFQRKALLPAPLPTPRFLAFRVWASTHSAWLVALSLLVLCMLLRRTVPPAALPRGS